MKWRTEPFPSSILHLQPVALLVQNHDAGCRKAEMRSQKAFKKIKIFHKRKEMNALASLYIYSEV